MARQKLTLDDLSAELKLSKFSVSRALSGKRGVSPGTRDAVIKAARELGYDHPSLRPGLRAAAEQAVLLAIPRDDAADNPYWLTVIASAEAEARRLGYLLVTTMIDGDGLADDRTATFNGLLLAGRRSRGLLEPFLQARLPTVLIGYAKAGEAIDAVHVADWEAGYLIGSHLRRHHRVVAFVTDAPEDVPRNERLRGCRDAFADLAGGTVVKVPFDPRTGTQGFLGRIRGLGVPPTAIVCASDIITITAMLAVREAGTGPGGSLALIGSNELAVPSASAAEMTTLRTPMHDLGTAAMAVLAWRIAVGAGPSPRRLALAAELVIRGAEAAGAPAGAT
jgi:LacI family transcriptional regulator